MTFVRELSYQPVRSPKRTGPASPLHHQTSLIFETRPEIRLKSIPIFPWSVVDAVVVVAGQGQMIRFSSLRRRSFFIGLRSCFITHTNSGPRMSEFMLDQVVPRLSQEGIEWWYDRPIDRAGNFENLLRMGDTEEDPLCVKS